MMLICWEITDLLCPKHDFSTVKYRQFALRIWPLTLTFDLHHCFDLWLLLQVSIDTYMLSFNLLQQILSVFTIFDNAFRRVSTYRPVARKPEVVAQFGPDRDWRGCPAEHFGSYPISLRQILKILCACEISSFYVTYLTSDLDLWPWPEMSRWKINVGPI